MSRPDSIKTIGLKAHLDATKDKHNGKSYAEFVKFIRWGQELGEDSPPVTKMARAFGVRWDTMNKWLMLYNEEKRQ